MQYNNIQYNTIQYFIDTPHRGFFSDNMESLKRFKSHAVELKERWVLSELFFIDFVCTQRSGRVMVSKEKNPICDSKISRHMAVSILLSPVWRPSHQSQHPNPTLPPKKMTTSKNQQAKKSDGFILIHN